MAASASAGSWGPLALSAGARRLARGVSWSILGGIVAQASVLLSAILAARLLGKLGYGHLAGLQATASALANLASLGLGVVATKYVSQYRNADPMRAGRVLGLASAIAMGAGVLAASGLVTFAPWIARRSFQSASLTPGLRGMAVYVLFTIWNGYQAGALGGLEAFRRVAQVSAACGLFGLLAMVLMAAAMGEPGAVLAIDLSAFMLWACQQIALRRELRRAGIRVDYRGAWRERHALLHFALPATFSGVIGSLAIWSCYSFLARERGFGDLALYAAANNLRAAVVFVPNLITRVTTPLLNNLLANGQERAYRRMFWFGVGVNGAVAVAVAGVLAWSGPWLLAAFGKSFHATPGLLWVMVGSAVVEVLACNLYQATFAGKSLAWQLLVITVWSGALFGVTRWSVPRLGPTGLAAAYAISWATSAVIYLQLSRGKRLPQGIEADCATGSGFRG